MATAALLMGMAVGGVLAVSTFRRKVRAVPTWTCGEIQPNDEMIIPGTHFYKTVSSMGGLRQMYRGQENGYFDLYHQSGRAGLALTGILQWMHGGILPVYLTWVMSGCCSCCLWFRIGEATWPSLYLLFFMVIAAHRGRDKDHGLGDRVGAIVRGSLMFSFLRTDIAITVVSKSSA
jgi:hypothetical protein